MGALVTTRGDAQAVISVQQRLPELAELIDLSGVCWESVCCCLLLFITGLSLFYYTKKGSHDTEVVVLA